MNFVERAEKLARLEVRANKKWRFGYAKHVLRNVEICAARPENALKVAEAGLTSARAPAGVTRLVAYLNRSESVFGVLLGLLLLAQRSPVSISLETTTTLPTGGTCTRR